MFAPIARGRLVKSKHYNQWIEKNLSILKDNLKPIENYPVEIELVVYSNHEWKNRNDLDNCIKPTIDLLVKAEIIPDDTTKYIENVSIRHVWMTGKPIMSIAYYQVEK